jgi:mannose-6-phosphate isomerase-like protein (cupin superfamily)
MMKSVNLSEKLSTFNEYWQPRTIGVFNGHDLMVVKVKGEFIWHRHDETDDFFLVLKGTLIIQLREGSVTLKPGELFGCGGRGSPSIDRTHGHAQYG